MTDIRAASRVKTLCYMQTTGSDQPVHLHSLICTPRDFFLKFWEVVYSVHVLATCTNTNDRQIGFFSLVDFTCKNFLWLFHG